MIVLKVVTPRSCVLDEVVDQISVTTTAGHITIKNKHEPIVSTIAHGELSVTIKSDVRVYAVSTGIITVRPHTQGVTEVTLLVEYVDNVDEMSVVDIESAIARAKEAKSTVTEDDMHVFEFQLERELNRYHIVTKHRHRTRV